MELPGEQFVRDLRAEIGAVHMLTCGLAFATSTKVDMQSDASPDKQREMRDDHCADALHDGGRRPGAHRVRNTLRTCEVEKRTMTICALIIVTRS